MSTADRIFLIGFSTTGKSTVGRLVAASLGFTFCDTDDLIEQMAGRSIPEIFAQDGEPAFRAIEREALLRVSSHRRIVVATGGGIVLDERNRRRMAERGIVILLEARPTTIYARLKAALADGSSGTVRPLLQSSDPLARIESLKAARRPLYAAAADWTVNTDELTPEQVAAEAVHGYRRLAVHRDPTPDTQHPTGVTVRTPSGSYPVVVGDGTLAELGDLMARLGLKGRAFVIADRNAFDAHGSALLDGLTSGGFRALHYLLPPGEETKSLAVAEQIFDWLIGERAERLEPIVAFGGGVVGDLAGFGAATYLRGVPFVQVPTTLLAMVDASVGGKTGVNHRRGKNLIGAFHQPRLVLVDVATLASLPARELMSGWAEVIKHAAIQDPALFADLEAGAETFRRLGAGTAAIIERSIAIKAGIVAEDERESGKRMLLNYGHTIAHGIEAATGYGQYLHGEAVAVGIVGASRIAQRIDILTPADVQRQHDLLERFGLPTRAPGIPADAIAAAMKLDKKVRQAAIRWILLEAIGSPVIRSDVPDIIVAETVAELVGA